MLTFLTGRLILVRTIMFCAVFALVTIGILTIYAAGNPAESTEGIKLSVSQGLWKRQIVFAAAGLLCIVAMNLFSYRWLGPLSYWIYALILVLLAALLVAKFLGRYDITIPFMPSRHGTYRWFRLGWAGTYIQLQPSEFCKIAYILALAWYLRYRKNYRKFKGLIGPFAMTLFGMMLILLEPDLGTVLLMMPVLFAMLFVAGAKIKHLLIIMLLAVVVSPFLWQKMHAYQRMRMASVLLQNKWIRKQAIQHERFAVMLAGSKKNVEHWERDHGYQITHSKRAIASGGLWGYGFRKGPYLKYDYNVKYQEWDPVRLPERQNDLIFAIIAHQFGLVGCCVVLGLYIIIIACGIEIAWQNTEPFGRLTVIGIIAIITMEVIVNVSMTVGLMPITGLTLPLVSYGGSSLLVSLIAIGLLNNIGRDRPFSIAGNPFEHKN